MHQDKMTKDDVIRMAKEAGCIPRRHPEYWDDVQVFATPDVLERFAALVAAFVAAHEREACAEACEQISKKSVGAGWPHGSVADDCAAAIRARGQA